MEGAKMNQIAIQGEGRNAIGNLLLRSRRRLADREPDLGQNRLNIRGETGDVLVDISGRDARFFHTFISSMTWIAGLVNYDAKRAS